MRIRVFNIRRRIPCANTKLILLRARRRTFMSHVKPKESVTEIKNEPNNEGKSMYHHFNEIGQSHFKILDAHEIKRPITPLKTGERKDVILAFENSLPTANIPHRLYTCSDLFSWGYLGSGPTALSLNILYHFSDGDLKLAQRLKVKFLDVIETLPMKQSILLSGEFIQKWILENDVPDEDKASYLFHPQLSPDGYVWTLGKLTEIEIKKPTIQQRGSNYVR